MPATAARPAPPPSPVRCWASKPLDLAYHDEEWGVPQHDDRALFELLILEGAQAGLSWSTILAKRENYRRAFDHFDATKVARYNARKVQSVSARATDPGLQQELVQLLSHQEAVPLRTPLHPRRILIAWISREDAFSPTMRVTASSGCRHFARRRFCRLKRNATASKSSEKQRFPQNTHGFLQSKLNAYCAMALILRGFRCNGLSFVGS